MLNLSLFMCQSGKPCLKFPDWTFAQRVERTHVRVSESMNTHTHTHTHVQTQAHKLNGRENLTQLSWVSVSAVTRWCSLAGLLDYQCSGSWAWPVKIKETLMKWTMWEQRGLLSTDGRNPLTLRGETVTVSYWPEWPGWLPQLHNTLFREQGASSRVSTGVFGQPQLSIICDCRCSWFHLYINSINA